MRNYILFIIIIILLFSINSCNSKKEDNLIKILAIALGMAPADSGVTGSGNTSETQPNPSDDSFYNNTPGVNPNDTTDFGAGGNVVPPTTPPGPSSPPPIGPSVPFGDTNPVITAQVLKTPTIVDRYQDIIIEFSENMKRDSVCLGENSGNLTITNISNNDRSCRWATDKQLLIRHYKPLDPLTDYTITISGGAVSLFDSSRSFSNFTNPTASGNTFTFKTEPEHKVSFTINFDGANYTVDNSKGLNLATNSAANSTITVTSINNSIGADIIQLKKIGSDDVYEVCNGGCSTTIFSGFNLSVNSSLPSSLLVTTGMNSYLLIIKSRVTTNPEQFKNYYRTFNFNYGNHSINPMTYQYNTGSLVLEKGQPHWSLLGSSGSSQGTLDVLAFFLEHFAEKSFTLKSNYSGSPIVETFNQILQREMKNTLPATNCYVPSNNTYANCPLFNDPDNSIIASKRADPYGVFPASQEGLPYVPNHPILPFSYFTRVGPFTKLQLPNGDDGLYYLDNLQEVTSGSISSGIDELVRNNIALPGFIADIAANVLDWLIAGILDVVVGILNGVGKVGGENYPSSLRLRYNFFADAYPNQAVVGKATKSLLKTDAILTPDSNHEPELINPIIDISGNDLIVKMNARELHAALMLAMDLQKLQIELYFLDFVNYSFPISINISTDILDWFDEICVVDICGPDLTSPKWPPPISFQIHMNWYTMGFLSGVTDLLKGFYIFRVYADLDSSTTNTAMYANEYPSSYPPGFPKPYAESNIIGTANVDASSLLRLYVPNPIYGAGGITATDWYNGLQGTIGTSALPNPAVLASTTDLGNAKNSMDSVTTGNIVERIMWDVLRALLADPGAALVNGIVSAILSDALLQAFPYVKPFIVNALLNDIIKNIATDIFNAILDPLKKGVKLSMPDF
ncbi:MAG: Ig-like domain-containing protein, partial [Leptospiraceae bacterium]|nr:Ig-like domain-containing protein [Leptospiraceae bacterium]